MKEKGKEKSAGRMERVGEERGKGKGGERKGQERGEEAIFPMPLRSIDPGYSLRAYRYKELRGSAPIHK